MSPGSLLPPFCSPLVWWVCWLSIDRVRKCELRGLKVQLTRAFLKVAVFLFPHSRWLTRKKRGKENIDRTQIEHVNIEKQLSEAMYSREIGSSIPDLVCLLSLVECIKNGSWNGSQLAKRKNSLSKGNLESVERKTATTEETTHQGSQQGGTFQIVITTSCVRRS